MIKFNDTDKLRGLVQLYEEEIGANTGDVSNNSNKLKKFTARVNNALDRYFAIAIKSSGKWQLDDSNHTDYNIITTTLTQGRRDYPFVTDEQGNLVLDIYKVLVKNTTTGKYEEIYPVDVQSDYNTQGFTDGQNTQGNVIRYDKTGNSLFLDQIPQETVPAGLKVYINRESSYFTSSDTTKTPGYPYHQEYFFLKPALDYARINNLAVLPRLEKQILDLEGDVTTGKVGLIAQAYGRRSKDETLNISGECINSI